MTTERETEPVHYYVGPLMACGVSAIAEPGTTRVGTTCRADATCPECLAALGEPRVVSGTDAGEGTAEPTMYQIACPPGIPLVSPQADRMRAEALEAMKRCSTFAETTVGGQAQCKLPSGHECPHEYNHAVTARRRAERGTVPAPVLLSPCCFCSNEQACIAAGKCSQRETSEARCTVPAPAATKENLVEAAEDPTWSPGPPCRGCGRPLYLCNLRVADGCPCNGPRGLNHGIVPVLTCTCGVCDPAKTGSTRQPFDVPAPAETPPVKSFDTSLAEAQEALRMVGTGKVERTVLVTEGARSYAAPAETPAPTCGKGFGNGVDSQGNGAFASICNDRPGHAGGCSRMDSNWIHGMAGERHLLCGLWRRGDHRVKSKRDAVVTCPKCRQGAAPAPGAAPSQAAPGLIRACGDLANANDYAAPAPGVWEGARELTFAEAMKGLERGQKWRRRAWFDGLWTKRGPDLAGLHVYADDKPQAPVSFADMLATDWEPLPAPAPKPGRVAEMVEAEAGTYEGNTVGIISTEGAHALCKRVVEAHQEEIRRRLIGGWQSSKATADIDKLLADARVAMLGAEAGK